MSELIKPCERGVEVRLVVHLAAVHRVAVDRENHDLSPLGIKALLRAPVRRLGDDRAEFVEAVDGLDVSLQVGRHVPGRMDVREQVARHERDPVSVVDVLKVWSHLGRLVSVECGIALCDGRPHLWIGSRFTGQVSRVEFSEEQATAIFYLSVLVIPELLMIIGLAVWWRRSTL